MLFLREHTTETGADGLFGLKCAPRTDKNVKNKQLGKVGSSRMHTHTRTHIHTLYFRRAQHRIPPGRCPHYAPRQHTYLRYTHTHTHTHTIRFKKLETYIYIYSMCHVILTSEVMTHNSMYMNTYYIMREMFIE